MRARFPADQASSDPAGCRQGGGRLVRAASLGLLAAGLLAPAWAFAQTMTVTGFPSPVTAGTAGSFTVTVTPTTYTGTVHFTTSDGSATPPSDYTFVSGDNGQRIFSMVLVTAGTQSITATDT